MEGRPYGSSANPEARPEMGTPRFSPTVGGNCMAPCACAATCEATPRRMQQPRLHPRPSPRVLTVGAKQRLGPSPAGKALITWHLRTSLKKESSRWWLNSTSGTAKRAGPTWISCSKRVARRYLGFFSQGACCRGTRVNCWSQQVRSEVGGWGARARYGQAKRPEPCTQLETTWGIACARSHRKTGGKTARHGTKQHSAAQQACRTWPSGSS